MVFGLSWKLSLNKLFGNKLNRVFYIKIYGEIINIFRNII